LIDPQCEDDPADIHPEFVMIAKLIIEANQNQMKKKKNAEPQVQQKVNPIKVPELLLRSRKFN
jgi:hypothetical protein